MRKVYRIAVREIIATITTKAFIIGLLVLPAMILVGSLVVPRFFNSLNFNVEGDVVIVDLSGVVVSKLQLALSAGTPAAKFAEESRKVLAEFERAGPILDALRKAPNLHLIERPADADIEQEKAWLNEEQDNTRHLALVIIHADVVKPSKGETEYGTYDLYIPPNLGLRAEIAIHQSIREAIVSARVQDQQLDRGAIDAVMRVPRVQSITVTKDDERQTVGGFNMVLPMGFLVLMFIGVMSGGQALLTSTIEEKSSRVVEVLLSAVSPMELMAGKLFGHMIVSLLAMSIYILMGLAVLMSFSMLGLIDLWLIFYLLIFYLITYFVLGSLMMAVGSAVNEMSEAQTLMMPLMLIMMLPWFLAIPITRDPSSTFSVVVSFLPPVNTFAMLLRMASNVPPPMWQVWLTIIIGIASVYISIWIAAKVFRIGLLIYGKPPDFATLIRWVRAA